MDPRQALSHAARCSERAVLLRHLWRQGGALCEQAAAQTSKSLSAR